jgi:creatinine amidohydrolase
MIQNKTRPYNLLEEMNAVEVKKKIDNRTIALVILGACENHGDHLPFGSDFIFPLELAKKIASKQKNIIILPAVPYGVSLHHDEFQMTMSLRPDSLKMVIEDVLTSIIKNGIKRIVIINGHDGNIAPIEIAARVVKNNHPDAIIACLEAWWNLLGNIAHDLFDVWQGLGHGGEAETSTMLATRPDLVQMNQAPITVIPRLPKNVRIYWKFNELSKSGATGGSREATLKKGQTAIRALERVLRSFMLDMDQIGWKYGISAE